MQHAGNDVITITSQLPAATVLDNELAKNG